MSYIKVVPYNPVKHKLFVINGERTFIITHGSEAVCKASKISQYWNCPGFDVYVAEINNKPVAYTIGVHEEYNNVVSGNLYTIFTLKQFRRKGIMKKLLTCTIADLYKRYSIAYITARSLLDDIRSDNVLIACGFEIDHINTDLYNGLGGKVLIHTNLKDTQNHTTFVHRVY